jgi:hypothetical protein
MTDNGNIFILCEDVEDLYNAPDVEMLDIKEATNEEYVMLKPYLNIGEESVIWITIDNNIGKDSE